MDLGLGTGDLGLETQAYVSSFTPSVWYSFANRRACSSYADSKIAAAGSAPITAPAVNTVGGLPARVSRAATSALIEFTSRQPPTVEPGATEFSSPSILT